MINYSVVREMIEDTEPGAENALYDYLLDESGLSDIHCKMLVGALLQHSLDYLHVLRNYHLYLGDVSQGTQVRWRRGRMRGVVGEIDRVYPNQEGSKVNEPMYLVRVTDASATSPRWHLVERFEQDPRCEAMVSDLDIV